MWKLRQPQWYQLYSTCKDSRHISFKWISCYYVYFSHFSESLTHPLGFNLSYLFAHTVEYKTAERSVILLKRFVHYSIIDRFWTMKHFTQQLLVYGLVAIIIGLCEQVRCDDYPEVATSLGTIKGTRMLSYHGKAFSAFRGIRYAQPPVGELRFKVSLCDFQEFKIIQYTPHSGTCTSTFLDRHLWRNRWWSYVSSALLQSKSNWRRLFEIEYLHQQFTSDGQTQTGAGLLTSWWILGCWKQ